MDNSSQAIEELLDVYCHKLVNGQEIVAKESGSVFVTKTPEIYEHDADGNLIKDGKFEYQWDGENRVVSATNYTNTTKLEFTYDYMNRMTNCKVYNWTGSDWQLSSTEKYVWDSYNLIATFTGSPADTLTHSYLWGEDLSGTLQGAGGVGGLIAETDHASSKSYLACYDGNGNIMAYIDSGTCDAVASYEYDPFGKTIVKSGPKADDFTFRFSTKPYREETGMIEYELVPYNPEIGRRPTRDPIGISGGINEYVINQNDFINNIDFLGLDFIAVAHRGVQGTDEFYYHYSLEYWKCPCDFEPLNHTAGFTEEEVKKKCTKTKSPTGEKKEGLELLARDGWTAWAAKQRWVGGGRYWGKVNVWVSEIVYSDTSNKVGKVMPIKNGSPEEIKRLWDRIVANARKYPWAEQEGKYPPFNKWPKSKYKSYQTNSNTFIRDMVGQAGLNMVEMDGRHPGNMTPSQNKETDALGNEYIFYEDNPPWKDGPTSPEPKTGI